MLNYENWWKGRIVISLCEKGESALDAELEDLSNWDAESNWKQPDFHASEINANDILQAIFSFTL